MFKPTATRYMVQNQIKWYHYLLFFAALYLFIHGLHLFIFMASRFQSTREWIQLYHRSWTMIIERMLEICVGSVIIIWLLKRRKRYSYIQRLIRWYEGNIKAMDDAVLIDFCSQNGLVILRNSKIEFHRKSNEHGEISFNQIDFVNINYQKDEVSLDVVVNKSVVKQFHVIWIEKWYQIINDQVNKLEK